MNNLLYNIFAAKQDDRALLSSLEALSSGFSEASFTTTKRASWPPTTEDELKRLCKQQSDAFARIKEGSKNSHPILRRGALSYVRSRERTNRKYCTNSKSEPSQRFLAANRCLMSEIFNPFRKIEGEIAQTLYEVAKRNYTTPEPELKQLCCLFYNAKTVSASCSLQDLHAPSWLSRSDPEQWPTLLKPTDH